MYVYIVFGMLIHTYLSLKLFSLFMHYATLQFTSLNLRKYEVNKQIGRKTASHFTFFLFHYLTYTNLTAAIDNYNPIDDKKRNTIEGI